MPARIAIGNVGQASISRAKSGTGLMFGATRLLGTDGTLPPDHARTPINRHENRHRAAGLKKQPEPEHS